MKNFFSSSKNAPFDNEQQLQDAETFLVSIKPILDKVHNNKAVLLMSKGFDWIEEYIYYLIALACFGFLFIMKNIFPFHVLEEMTNKPSVREHFLSANDVDLFALTIKGMIVLIGLLFIFLGTKKRVIRKSKDALYLTSNELKKIETYFQNKKE
ncbi:MAG: hypothetical protein IT215_02215, partial [Chitinophagaceae bacterium]|nr:hypothetical protein [Chitinophagaceae bacterium]